MAKKVLRLIDYENNSRLWTPKDMFREIEEEPCDGALVLLIEQGSGEFKVKWQQAQLRLTDCIAAMEILKDEMTDLLRGKG